MKNAFILLFLASLFFASFASADIVIGNGFSCDGTSIKKGTKVVSYSKAKSNIATTIEKLKTKLANAPKKKKQSIKDQITAAKNSKTLITSCSKGTLAPNQVDPVFTNLASAGGTYNGNYSGSVHTPLGTQQLSGTVNLVFSLSGTVFSAVLTLGGNLGSALNAKPLTFSNDVGGVGFPAQFLLQNTFLGDVTLSVTQDGHLTIVNSNSSKASVSFDGQFSGSTITGTINGSYSSLFTANFEGSYSAARQ